MPQAPQWTEVEFGLLLSRAEAPSSEIASELPRRTIDAVDVVRQGVHEFHTKGESSMLSQTMVRALGNASNWTCPVCHQAQA